MSLVKHSAPALYSLIVICTPAPRVRGVYRSTAKGTFCGSKRFEKNFN